MLIVSDYRLRNEIFVMRLKKKKEKRNCNMEANFERAKKIFFRLSVYSFSFPTYFFFFFMRIKNASIIDVAYV